MKPPVVFDPTNTAPPYAALLLMNSEYFNVPLDAFQSTAPPFSSAVLYENVELMIDPPVVACPTNTAPPKSAWL